MADPIYRYRTNYFHVKDEDKFRAVMEAAGFTESNNRLWTNADGGFGFGTMDNDFDGSISPAILLMEAKPDIPLPVRGLANYMEYDRMLHQWCREHDIDEETVYAVDYPEPDERANALISMLQPLIADGECIIIETIGYEKLRALWGEALIITPDKTEWVSLDSAIRGKVTELVGADYKYQLEY